jgi:hypothetical protein
MSTNKQPPKLAIWMLNTLLPDSVKDDISGDLTEEFNYSKHTTLKTYCQFWQQTLTTCWRYSMTKQLFTSLVLTFVSLITTYLLVKAVIFLSVADNPLFLKDYWLNGNVYLLFTEEFFWSNSFGENAYQFEWNMFMHMPSIIWALSVGALIYSINRSVRLNLSSYIVLALIACFAPYVYGMLTLRFTDMSPKETGPIIAFMWISIIYLILPLSVGVMRKLYANRSKAIDL